MRRIVFLSIVSLFLVLWLEGSAGEALALEESAPAENVTQTIGTPVAADRDKDGKLFVSKTLGVTISGYLEGSYTQNFNNPSSGVNQLRIFDVDSNKFRPNVAKFVLEREAKTEGTGWDLAGFRVKFNAGKDSDFIGGTNLNNYADFQEFYFQYVLPVGRGLDVKVGRINTLIGYEALESPLDPNYSRSWLFGLGQPFTTLGVRVSYEFNKQVSFSIGGINSITSATSDATNDLMVESALVLTPSDRFKLTFYGLFGPRSGQSPGSGGNRLLGGGILQVQVTDKATVVLESYYANQTNSSVLSRAKNARWDGVAAYAMYDFTEQWSVRFRGEVFEDAGGYVSCNGTLSFPMANVCFGATQQGTGPDIAQTLWETTSTLQYKPFESLMTRLEYRYDRSNQNVFQVGGRAAGFQPTLTFNIVYFF